MAGRAGQGGDPGPLIAGLGRGAADVRIHARVVERTGEDRHGDGAGRAAVVDVLFEITPLARGDAADDQPDHEHQRSDVHLCLRQHRPVKNEVTAVAIA